MTLNDDRVIVAFYDAGDRWLYLADGGRNGFSVYPLRGQFPDGYLQDPGGRYTEFDTHPIGQHCAIVPHADGIHVAFTDQETWSLLSYHGPIAGGGHLAIIDEASQGRREFIGAGVVARLDHLGRMVVVYQNSTNNDVMLNVHTPDGWLPTSILVDGDGAVGFGNALVMDDAMAIIGTVRMRTIAGGRENSQVQVYRLDLRAY